MSEPSQPEHAQRALDAFLVDNPELEALSARLAKFNLFRVLRAEKQEVRHSNLLAWLLTPPESHGLGANFLRRFLSRLLMENQSLDIPLTPAQVELMAFDDIEVLREWRNVDIVVQSKREPSWCLLIENKLGSKESPGQLVRYFRAATTEFPRHAMIPVLLTLEGDEASDDGREAGYVALSYVQILELAERIVEQNRSRVPEDAQVLLDHYLETLRRLTMQDDELVQLCKTIYRRHREAIDLIVEYGAASQVLDICEEKISQVADLSEVLQARNRVWFLPRTMAAAQRAVVSSSRWRFLPRGYPVWWWFHYRKRSGRLQLTMEVGPVEPPDLRVRLLRATKAAGFSFREGGLEPGTKYTRILTKTQRLRTTDDGAPDDDPEYVKTVAESLWKKAWQEGAKVLDVLKAFDWKQSPPAAR